MSDVELPLFPLQVVLFPNSILPVHIFEERYKQLINECLDEGKEFGINLVHDNITARVGCTAFVTRLVKRYENGRMDILVQGGGRYRLSGLVQRSALYPVGQVTILSSVSEAPDRQLVAETVRLHNHLIGIVYKGSEYKVALDPRMQELSFTLAQKAGMELQQRQQLLELDSENERLKMLRAYFVDVIPRLERRSEVQRVQQSDGYIVH